MTQQIGESAPLYLPIDLDFTPKKNAVPARSRRINIQALSGGLFSPGDVSKFEIPCGQGLLDPSQTVLYFRVQNMDTTGWFVDHSCASFIQKIEVFSSSQLLETVNEFGALHAILMDTQYSSLDRQGYQSLLLGCDASGSDLINFSRGGAFCAGGTGTPGNATGGSVLTFALPLMSGVVGVLLNKYLPLDMISDLRVEITWANNANAVISPTTTSTSVNYWRVNQVELICQLIVLDSEVSNMINSAGRGGPIMISTEMYRNYNTVLSAAQASDSTLLPLKFTSTKSFIAAYRLNGNQNTANVPTISARRNPFASSGANNVAVQFLVGNTYVPQQPLRNSVEIFCEYQKAFHSLANVNNKSVMNRNTYDSSVEGSGFAYTITATTTGTNVITLNTVAGLSVGAPFVVSTAVGGLVAGTLYYIISILAGGATVIVSASPNGAPLALSSTTAQTIVATSPCGLWSTSPSFALGINLDSFYQNSLTSHSGMNTQGGNVFLNATYSANTPAGGTRLDTWCDYDAILVIDPATKQMTVRI